MPAALGPEILERPLLCTVVLGDKNTVKLVIFCLDSCEAEGQDEGGGDDRQGTCQRRLHWTRRSVDYSGTGKQRNLKRVLKFARSSSDNIPGPCS